MNIKKRIIPMLLSLLLILSILPAGVVDASTIPGTTEIETLTETATQTETETSTATASTIAPVTETETASTIAPETETASTIAPVTETATASTIAPVTAATTVSQFGSLTIQNTSGVTKTNSSYSAYKIVTFDASNLDGNTVYTNMKLIPAYRAAIISAISSLTNSSTDKQILTAISGLNADNTAALAIALKGVTTTTVAYTTDDGVFDSMVYGYYLVIETANQANDGTVISKPILVSIPDSTTNHSVIVKVKTSKAMIEKKIVENNGLVDSSTASVGDTVNYQSLSTFPTYSADATGITYYITDTFSAGLNFNPNNVVVKIVAADGTSLVKNLTAGDYTLATSNIGNASFRITLNNTNDIKAWGNASNKLLVTYSATLDEAKATYGNVGNPNSINLTYSNKPGAGGNTYTTPYDTVITYTTKLIITKTDGTKVLPGATFELSMKNSDATWTVIGTTQTTDNNGIASFTKLEQGTYRLIEKVAPSGYDLLSEPIEFTVNAKNGDKNIPSTSITVTQSGNVDALAFKATWLSNNTSISVNCNTGIISTSILNAKGFTLPGTGGVGTTIFTFSGIVIILLGCSMIFVYLKKNKASKLH